MNRYLPAAVAAPVAITAAAAFVIITAFLPAPCAGREDQFYCRAVGGYSLPFLPGISDELEIQGREGLGGGYGGGISLGRTLLNRRWAVEAYFALSFYPKFDYENEFEQFRGEVSQYDYAVVFKRNLLPDGERFIPYIGVGAGYGITNLISGGGKIQTFHAHALFQIEVPIGDNLSFLFESTYGTALTREQFEKPFLENMTGDVVLDSAGMPIEDRLSSFNIRIGIMVWLRLPKEEE